MTVYVLSPENDQPSGGIKILYRHADVLNRCGMDAAVLHQKSGFRCTWFENDTRVAYLPDVRITEDDFLVVPEIYGPNIAALGGMPGIGRKLRKVIFNQNCRYTFLGQALDTVLQKNFSLPYTQTSEFAGAMVVSEDSKQYLEYTFPGLDVWRIHNAINVERFGFSADKKKQICFMPRKHAEDALQVLAILQLRGALGDFSVVPIEGENEAGVARILKESMFFLSFGYPEGCPLPPAEAMASGCLVVGYHGFGGREYFDPAFSWPVDVGDITGFAEQVERLIRLSYEQPESLAAAARVASDFVRNKYSPQQEQQDICSFWTRMHGL